MSDVYENSEWTGAKQGSQDYDIIQQHYPLHYNIGDFAVGEVVRISMAGGYRAGVVKELNDVMGWVHVLISDSIGPEVLACFPESLLKQGE